MRYHKLVCLPASGFIDILKDRTGYYYPVRSFLHSFLILVFQDNYETINDSNINYYKIVNNTSLKSCRHIRLNIFLDLYKILV